MTFREKAYAVGFAITLFGFIGPLATTTVMRGARIDQLEKEVVELQGFKQQALMWYIDYCFYLGLNLASKVST